MKKLVRITTIPLSLDKLLGKQLSYMNTFFEVTIVSSDEKELERVAKKYGVKHHSVEMTRIVSPVKDLAAVWKLYRFLKKEKPDIVHSHTPKPGIVGMMAAYFAGVPVRMHTVAGLPLLEASGAKRKLLDFVEKLTYRFATKVYPNSKGLHKIILQEKFCSPEKLKVIGNGSSNGIDTDYFSPEQLTLQQKTQLRENLGITENDFVFIFVGRLVKDKGINELVEAFKKLGIECQKQNLADPLLLLVGPSEHDLDPLLSETLKEIESNPKIISTGFQEDVRPYFAISNALVFPSYREGFPNVVLQAGAMELPAIVTDINGCNEIIENGKNGMIVPVKNVQVLQQKMFELLIDPDIYYSLKENARQHIDRFYRQSEIWKELLNEYQS